MLTKFFKRSEAPILIGVIASYFACFHLLIPEGWLKVRTLNNVFGYAAILGLIAIGETLLIICKEIDLSVGSVYAIVGIAFIALEPLCRCSFVFFSEFTLCCIIGIYQRAFSSKGKT